MAKLTIGFGVALDGTLAVTSEKAQILGALDLPGSTRHEEVEVAAELVR